MRFIILQVFVFVSTPNRFHSLAPKIGVNIMCSELMGCFKKINFHTTDKNTFIICEGTPDESVGAE